jgi:putative DNA primase/helicase
MTTDVSRLIASGTSATSGEAEPAISWTLQRGGAAGTVHELVTQTWAQFLDWFAPTVIPTTKRRKERVDAWTPARFEGDRKEANVLDVGVAVADIDAATDAQLYALCEKLGERGLAFAVHSTYTHKLTCSAHNKETHKAAIKRGDESVPAECPDDCAEPRQGKYRLAVQLSRRVARAEWPAFWAGFCDLMDDLVDRSTKGCSRIYFQPARPERGPEGTSGRRDGQPLDVDALLASAPSDDKRLLQALADKTLRAQNAQPEKVEGAETLALLLKGKDWAEHGERDTRLFNLAILLADTFSRKNPADIVEPIRDALIKHSEGETWSQGDAARELEVKIARKQERSPAARYEITETGLARRFAEWIGWRARFVAFLGWILWQRTHWIPTDARPTELVAAMLDEMQSDPPATDDIEEVENWIKLIKTFKTARKLNSILQLAERDPALRVGFDQLDSDPDVLNTPNGTIDLRTGSLSPHNPANLITKITGVDYSPFARSPEFEKCLEIYSKNDSTWIEFVRCWLGYSATGGISGEYWVFFEGTGANGKSTLMNLVRRVLGTYAGALSSVAIESPNAHTSSFGRLGKARFATTPEIDARKPIAVARLKAFNSYEPVSAQLGMGKDFVEITPCAKLTLSINGTPRIPEADRSIKRRLRVVPFRAELDYRNGALVRVDQQLLDRGAGPAILAWLVSGASEMLRRRGVLPECQAVTEATSAVLDANDPLADWLDSCCVRGEENISTPGALYSNYLAWCADQHLAQRDRLGSKSFGDRLEASGFPRIKSNGTRVHKGVGLRPFVAPGLAKRPSAPPSAARVLS